MTPGEVVAALGRAGLSVATAESLTGGLVCAALTDVPGASRVVRGGVVAYATDVKSSLLRVDAGLLTRDGTVNVEVAAAMAEGVRALIGADVGVSTTGVAGPGPTEGRPAGAVVVGVAGPWGIVAEQYAFSGGRDEVRRASVAAALALTGREVRRHRPDREAPGYGGLDTDRSDVPGEEAP
ncbi:MAG: CinA family protein [Dermatophilaceae bacterium]